MKDKPLSRKELIERLKSIAEEDIPREKIMGAKCYMPVFKPQRLFFYVCDCCRRFADFERSDYEQNVISDVNSIKALGYDVKIEVFCKDCAEKFAKQNNLTVKWSWEADDFDLKKDVYFEHLNFVFYFKLPEDNDYHCVLNNRYYHYKLLLAFLKNENGLFLRRYGEHYLADEIDVIEFMTGLKLNE